MKNECRGSRLGVGSNTGGGARWQLARCPECQRDVPVTKDRRLCVHAPMTLKEQRASKKT